MLLINCEINLILAWSENYVISSATGKIKFKVTDKNLYVSVVTLSTQGNVNLLEQLKFGFKRTINWNKYHSKTSIERQNTCLDFLIDPRFQWVNRLFVLSFEHKAVTTGYTRHF